jgi:hypothetical protein
VIEGGGKSRDVGAEKTIAAFRQLVIELLRSLARGGDDEGRVTTGIMDLVEIAATSQRPVVNLVRDAVADLRGEILESAPNDERAAGIQEIVTSALLLAAESMTDDEAASGRRAQRLHDLERAMERFVLVAETRSRLHGGSYLQDLTKRLPTSSTPPRKR